MSKFLIFALERSGSTSLASALNVADNTLHEPFTSETGEFKKQSSPYLDILKELDVNRETLPKSSFNPYFNKFGDLACNSIWVDNFLNKAYSQYRSIKHVWNTLSPMGNFNILSYCRRHDVKIIYQSRHCSHSVLSNMLANQVEVYQLGPTLENKEKVEDFKYSPINIQHLKGKIDICKTYHAMYRLFISQNRFSFIEVDYEQLYSPSHKDRIIYLNKIFLYLSLTKNDYLQKNIDEYIHNSARKQTSDAVLSKIPNYQALKEVL